MLEQDSEEQQRLESTRRRLLDEGIDPQLKAKSKNDDSFILACLKTHFIFYNLSDKELNNVRDYMFWAQIPEGTDVFHQGSVGSCFFIIVSGVVDVLIDNQSIKTLKASDGFGQLALIYDIERPSTVRVKENACFWVLQKVNFKEAVEEIVIGEFEETQKYLDSLPFYQFLGNKQKEKVASSFVILKYFKGQNIVEEGDPGSAFYIIKTGTASLLQGNLEERKIYQGESFGLNSLYYNTMRKMTVRADEEVVCQVLGRQTLAEILGVDTFKDTMFRNFAKHCIQKNKQLCAMVKEDEGQFFQEMKIKYYKINDLIYKKGSNVHKMVVVVEGKMRKSKSANILVEANQYWGEDYLAGNEARLQDDIIASTECVLVEIQIESLKRIKVQKPNKIRKEEDQIGRLSLEGISYLYELQPTNLGGIHLLKYQQKLLVGKLFLNKLLEKEGFLTVVNQSLKVQATLHHALLPRFYQAIQTPHYSLIISEYISGESFYDSIRNIGILSTQDCQFYMANILLLLEQCMAEEVVLRDLKPENLIVDQEGYIRLVSLNSAKQIHQLHRTATVIGTPHYMAPEIILGQQYNELVDLWSLGVILYECMVGELPFGAQTDNPYDIYELVIQAETSFPRNFRDRRAKKIIETLLSLNPEVRHGGSFSALKANSWFENIIWDELSHRNVKSPYRPTQSRELKPSQARPLEAFLNEID